MLLYFIVLIIRANLEISLLSSHSRWRWTALKNLFYLCIYDVIYLYTGVLFCTHALYTRKPAPLQASIAIYGPENIPLSPENPPGCSPTPLLSLLMYSLRSHRRFFILMKMTGWTLSRSLFLSFYHPGKGFMVLRGSWQAVSPTIISPPHYT